MVDQENGPEKKLEKKDTPSKPAKDKGSETSARAADSKRIEELEKKVSMMESRKQARPVQNSSSSGLKAAAALLLVLFVVASAAAVYFFNETRLNDDYETDYKGLMGDYNELSSLYNVLVTEKTSLEAQISSLNTQISGLTTQLNDAQSSNTTKDADIASLQTQIDEMETTLQEKQTRVAYLEVMIGSYQDRNADLEEQLDTCMEAEEATSTLHPYITSFWETPTMTYGELTEGGSDVTQFYIYLCVTCTDCNICSSCYPCDPCDPCAPVCDPCDPCGGSYCSPTYCCDTSGVKDAIRLCVQVTTYDDDDSGTADTYEYAQSLEVISWTWV